MAGPESDTVFPRVGRRTFFTFLALFYVAWSLRVVLLMPVDYGIHGTLAKTLWSQVWRFTIWVAPVVWMLARVHRVAAGRALGLTTLPRGRALLNCLIVTGLWIVVTAAWGTVLEGKSLVFSLRPTPAQWIAIFTTCIWAPLFEEVLFRGYVYQARRNQMPWMSAALLSGALFAAAHWPGWLYMQGLHAGLIMQTASITVIGFVLGAVFECGRSLWPCIVLHLCNNLLWAGPP